MNTIKYKRILLKLSGEALGEAGSDVFFDRLSDIARQIRDLTRLGVQAGIVVGGGNIWRGRRKVMDRSRADHAGMLATAINALAMQDVMLSMNIPCIVLSAVSMEKFCDTFSARSAQAHLENGTVVIFACGSGSPFFTTDTAAALRACEINADALLLAKNVDAVYDKNPDEYADAKPLSHPTYDELIQKNIQAFDLTAITLCKERNMPILVFPLNGENCLNDVLCGKNIGTLIDC